MIINNGGSTLLCEYYYGSPIKFVKNMFIEYNFLEWKFKKVPNGFWKNKENHKIFFNWLGQSLGFQYPEDWYRITVQSIIENDGAGLLFDKYFGSPIALVKKMLPDYDFLEWKFNQVPLGFWENYVNRIQFFNWLGKTLGFQYPEDWYKITKDVIYENECGGLLKYYSNSPIDFVKAMLPDYEFLEWKFVSVPQGFWNKYENQKRYTEWLGKELGYTCPEDWYQITCQLIHDNYGSGRSPINFVKAMFPDYEFLEWKFKNVQLGFWKDYKNRKQYICWLSKYLGYKSSEDWYQITYQLIVDNYGSTLLSYYSDSPFKLIKAMFPEYPWISSKFKKSYSRGQIEWLEFIKISRSDISHILNEGEFKIPNSKYRADGYSQTENCIYEYHGDFWHGNPKLYNSEEINSMTKTSYGKLYENTLKKQKFCEESNYKYYSIWESEWVKGKNAVIKLQRIFRKNISKFKYNL